MKRLAVLACFFLSAPALAAPSIVDDFISSGTSTLQMAGYCREIKDQAQPQPNGSINIPSTFAAGMCWGAFTAFRALPRLSISVEGGGAAVSDGACFPKGITTQQVVLVFMAYAAAHPADGHRDYLLVSNDALSEAFPCPTK